MRGAPLDRSTYEACLERIAAHGGRAAREAQKILDEVQAKGEELQAEGVADPYVAAAQRLSDAVRAKAAIERAEALTNALKRSARIGEATQGMTTVRGAGDTLRGRLVWQPGGDERGNVQALAGHLTHNWASAHYAELQKAGLVKYVGNPESFGPIAIALGEIRGAEDQDAARLLAAAGNDPAKRAAAIIFPAQQAVRERLNAEGARIADARNWVATTQHDPYLLRRGGRNGPVTKDYEPAFQRWWEFVEPRLADKTFETLAEDLGAGDIVTGDQLAARERFGRAVFNALRTGVHMRQGRSLTDDGALPEGTPYLPAAYEGTRNIARKISEGRVLFWESPQAWSEYMGQYGRSTNWFSLMERSFEQGGRKAALMNWFGTNPEANLNLIVRNIAERFRDSDPDGVTEFRENVAGKGLGLVKPSLDTVMAHLDGRANVFSGPRGELWHQIFTSLAQVENMSYLGFVQLTHAASLVNTFPGEARYAGDNAFTALLKLMAAEVPDRLFDAVSPVAAAERHERWVELGAYGAGMKRYATDPFAHGYNGFGYVAAMHNRFMNATGLPFIFEHAQAGIKSIYAAKLGDRLHAEGDMAGLDPHLQNDLAGYGITPERWELLQQAELLHDAADQLHYLTPSAAYTIPDAAVIEHLVAAKAIPEKADEAAINRLVTREKQNIADAIGMLYEDSARRSVVQGGAREAAALRGTSRPGTAQYELAGAFMQFKTWPVAAMHQRIAREFYEGLSKSDVAWGVGLTIGLTAIGGALRIYGRDLFAGDKPREPRTIGEAARLGLAALAQGGGLGIFGDFLFGEMNRFGNPAWATVGGPVISDAKQLFDIAQGWAKAELDGKTVDAWPQLARWAIHHVPFANLIYIKAATDYLLWYHLFEAMKPGWWERTNRRMQKEQNRTMMGYQPGAGVPWGVPPFLSTVH